MSSIKSLNRREFLSLTGRTGGVFILGSALSSLGVPNTAKAATVAPKSDGLGSELGAFVSIKDDNTVEIICHRAEMGQGILTSVPQIIAEELGADWSQVNAILGNANPAYGNQNTGGSASIRKYFLHTRQMGAIARDMLEQAAANKWGVKKSLVRAENSHVSYQDKSLSFAALAQDAAKLAIPDVATLSLKSADDFTLIGKEDIELQGVKAIVTGTAGYAHDVQLPDMLIASIERPPVVGGKVKSFDASETKKLKGVVDVIIHGQQLKAVKNSRLNGTTAQTRVTTLKRISKN